MQENYLPDDAARVKSLVDLRKNFLFLLIICDKQRGLSTHNNTAVYVLYAHSIWSVCTHLSYQISIVLTNSCDRHKLSPPLPGLETFPGQSVSDNNEQMRAMSFWGGAQKHTQCTVCIYTSNIWASFCINRKRYLLQLFELGVLELLQCVSVFFLYVTQACVTDLVTHFLDVCQCRT